MAKKLNNFRGNKFFLFNKSIEVAGMAGPHNNYHLGCTLTWFGTSARLETLKVLKKKNRLVYINLHESEDFQEEAKAVGIEYHWLRVEDFSKTPLPPNLFDNIYELVKKATLEGKLVTISCGEGNGRTGTALASLKLRELLEEDFRNNSNPSHETKATEIFEISKDKLVPCTPLVKRAIELIRNERITGTDFDEISNGLHSVETAIDINSLINYETYLRQKIANELKTQPGTFADDAYDRFSSYCLHTLLSFYWGCSKDPVKEHMANVNMALSP